MRAGRLQREFQEARQLRKPLSQRQFQPRTSANLAKEPQPASKPVPQPRMQAAANATPQEAKLDAAKQAVAMAQAEVMKFGSRQKQADPAGFERARQAAAQAAAALDAAKSEYEQSLAGGYSIPRMVAQP